MQSPVKNLRRAAMAILLVVVLWQLPACYYMQAARGHLNVMHQRRPIDEVLADEKSPQALKERLEIVRQARNFAVSELLLPDNDSYRSYSDLGRDYVVWNVFAAPEFSLEPKRWCFPVAGCVAYKGYFEEDDAIAFAAKLSNKDFDVAVGGVSAYSTLGKFADPVLNTMMRWSDIELVSTIFHELAHQKLYVKGDTAFNESFATAVETAGIERWLNGRDDASDRSMSEARRLLRRDVMRRVNQVRDELDALYAENIADDEKRRRKRAILDRLSADAGEIIEQRDVGLGNWLAAPLNNARLVSLGLYEGQQNAFSKILTRCEGRLACFYDEAQTLAELTIEERTAQLALLAD